MFFFFFFFFLWNRMVRNGSSLAKDTERGSPTPAGTAVTPTRNPKKWSSTFTESVAHVRSTPTPGLPSITQSPAAKATLPRLQSSTSLKGTNLSGDFSASLEPKWLEPKWLRTARYVTA
mmetsp:Transcript_13922/g.11207  ORF Transcript_13922/g.11207 Transcript_13922/m.11207 type:complete len:119 (-) Transcript_13922:11-367(-)